MEIHEGQVNTTMDEDEFWSFLRLIVIIALAAALWWFVFDVVLK